MRKKLLWRLECCHKELSNIADWLAANKLSLNVGKSKLLVYSNKRTSKNEGSECQMEDMGIFINGEKLKEVDHAKYLGALIDNKLNWSYQINAVSLKVSKGLGLLAKIRH